MDAVDREQRIQCASFKGMGDDIVEAAGEGGVESVGILLNDEN